MMVIPPGTYRITRPLHVEITQDLTHHAVISAYGATFVPRGGRNVNGFELVSRAVARYVVIEGLQIRGNRKNVGHGIYISCPGQGRYLYNTCLRDVVVEGCNADGCRIIGNVFESQIINSYFRDNGANGLTLGHTEDRKGILSAMHLFGCVFGGNKRNGVALVNDANDVSFFGCYFLLNAKFGLTTSNGCLLLAHCGFENNHSAAQGFSAGDAGLRLQTFGTLIGCTAYSIYNQTHLVRAFIKNDLVMIGCTGSGGERARAAGLASLQGDGSASATLIGGRGKVENHGGIALVQAGRAGDGIGVSSAWNSGNLLRLGTHQLWVDREGRLRIKEGRPSGEHDGAVVGGGK